MAKAAPKGKHSTEEILPDRHALSEIVRGAPLQRAIGNYAKKTPLKINSAAPTILTMGKRP